LVWEAYSLSPEQDRLVVEQFRREAGARYAEVGASAQAIRDAVLRGRRRAARARRPAPAALAHALRQLRGLERAVRLERRRDYFRSPGRAAAAAAVTAAIADLEEQRPARRGGSGDRAVGD
jgi:hypothetical protein